MESVLTPGQVRKVLDPEKKIRWSSEDIASAISLRCVSPKSYRYLRSQNFPLPCMSTLRKWASSFQVDRGVLDDVMPLLKQKSKDFTCLEKLCILSFDEVYLSNRVDIDKKEQQKVGPHKNCQMVMIRGLVGKWKQPVYYNYDTKMTRQILENIISKIHAAGLIVVAIVSDMGVGNVSLWTQLNISHDGNCFFNHPSNNAFKIYVFADAPHLMKLARNHLLDNGYDINGEYVNKGCLEKLLDISTSELTISYKLTRFHLDVQGPHRQKVRPAVQIFSNTVSKAILYCGEKGLMPSTSSWKTTAATIKVFNDWFDLLNSRHKMTDHCPEKYAFGVELASQQSVLDNMLHLINSVRVGKHKRLIPFQKGIILTSRSLKELYDYLKLNYSDFQYILTYRLNQDVLENFFSYIRGMGGANDHPSPLQFKFRLKWYILGKHSSNFFTEGTNTAKSTENCLTQPFDEQNDYERHTDDICLTQNLLSEITESNLECATDVTNNVTSTCQDDHSIIDEFQASEVTEDEIKLLEEFENKENINQDALKYIAGYVAYRFKNKYPELGSKTSDILSEPDHSQPHDWIHFISGGCLLTPSEELMQAAYILDKEFNEMHGPSSLADEKYIFNKLSERTLKKINSAFSIPYEVIHCLSRTRTYIRLRTINRNAREESCRKQKEKKLFKFTNVKNKLFP